MSKTRRYPFLTVCIIVILIFIGLVVLLSEIDRHYSYHVSLSQMYKEQPLRPILGVYNCIIRASKKCVPFPSLDENFPDHKRFEQQWQQIAQEALNVYQTQKLPAFHEIHEIFNDISASNKTWTVFMLKWYDNPIHANMLKCPITANLIKTTPQVQAAMFSILQPGTKIPPHRGPACNSLRYHLGLKIPKPSNKNNSNSGRARIRIDKTWYFWKEGEGVLFDDTYEHEVINDTNEIRIVLFMDVLRPLPIGINYINKLLVKHANISEFVSTINSRAEVQEKL